ncbi:MAG: DUF134 domain-containing protein [Chloroflexi bacterium]|nr:DUF134 domain-containing protein [Chloroflexota bacterium]
MSRPRKRRTIGHPANNSVFKPAGQSLAGLERIPLREDELEALRLADLEGLSQVEAAEQMGVSRSTFQRIVTQARRQVAHALIDGLALEIIPDEDARREEKSRKKRRRRRQHD